MSFLQSFTFFFLDAPWIDKNHNFQQGVIKFLRHKTTTGQGFWIVLVTSMHEPKLRKSPGGNPLSVLLTVRISLAVVFDRNFRRTPVPGKCTIFWTKNNDNCMSKLLGQEVRKVIAWHFFTYKNALSLCAYECWAFVCILVVKKPEVWMLFFWPLKYCPIRISWSRKFFGSRKSHVSNERHL